MHHPTVLGLLAEARIADLRREADADRRARDANRPPDAADAAPPPERRVRFAALGAAPAVLLVVLIVRTLGVVPG